MNIYIRNMYIVPTAGLVTSVIAWREYEKVRSWLVITAKMAAGGRVIRTGLNSNICARNTSHRPMVIFFRETFFPLRRCLTRSFLCHTNYFIIIGGSSSSYAGCLLALTSSLPSPSPSADHSSFHFFSPRPCYISQNSSSLLRIYS